MRKPVKLAAQNLRWIIFDLDDTLIDSKAIYSRVYKQLRVGPEFLSARKRAKKTAGGKNPSQHNRLIYFKQLVMNQRSGSATETLKLMFRYEAALRVEVRRDLSKSEVQGILSKLRKHFRLAIFTNETLRTQLIKIQELDPKGQIFDLILTSEEIGQEKSQPGSYWKILRQLRTRADQCVMVGDSLHQDIQPAKNAGLRAIRIHKAGQLEPVLKLIPELGKLRANKVVSSR